MRHKFFSLLLFISLNVLATTPVELLTGYTAQAGQLANATRGEAFFKASHGQEWQCTSCHGQAPSVGGRHASTDKQIEPLAPATNPKRFTDSAKAEKWFLLGLDKHYGSDASLDAATQKQIDTWLQTYGGQGKRAFVKSPANFTACHRDGAQGDFEEDRVRIPK